MKIGCPAESKPQEYRVVLTPHAAREVVHVVAVHGGQCAGRVGQLRAHAAQNARALGRYASALKIANDIAHRGAKGCTTAGYGPASLAGPPARPGASARPARPVLALASHSRVVRVVCRRQRRDQQATNLHVARPLLLVVEEARK